MSGLLQDIKQPSDLRDLTREQLPELAAEIRQRILDTVSCTGGHLAPNLGVVELTIAIHRSFESPRDKDHLGCRPPVLHPQTADGSAGCVRPDSPGWWAVGLPSSRGVRA